MADKNIEDLDLHALLDENQESKALPHCLVCVDFQKRVHLVEVLNESEISASWMNSDFHEYLEGEEWDNDPGLYTADFDIHSWQDRNPDSCEWNSELVVHNIIPYTGGSTGMEVKFPALVDGYIIDRCSVCRGTGVEDRHDGGPLHNNHWSCGCHRCAGVGYIKVKVDDIPIVTEKKS